MGCEKCAARGREIKELEKQLCIQGFDGQYDRGVLEDYFFTKYGELKEFAENILPRLKEYPHVFSEEITVLEYLLNAYGMMDATINSYKSLLGKKTVSLSPF